MSLQATAAWMRPGGARCTCSMAVNIVEPVVNPGTSPPAPVAPKPAVNMFLPRPQRCFSKLLMQAAERDASNACRFFDAIYAFRVADTSDYRPKATDRGAAANSRWRLPGIACSATWKFPIQRASLESSHLHACLLWMCTGICSSEGPASCGTACC